MPKRSRPRQRQKPAASRRQPVQVLATFNPKSQQQWQLPMTTCPSRDMPLTCADFEFHIGLKPKARPRHVSGGPSYMPADYKKWIKEMRAQMAEHWTEPPLPVVNVLWCKFTAQPDLISTICSAQ